MPEQLSFDQWTPISIEPPDNTPLLVTYVNGDGIRRVRTAERKGNKYMHEYGALSTEESILAWMYAPEVYNG